MLSDAALALLRLHLERDHVPVTDENREAHRELARAGLLYPVSGFATGPESHYRFTEEGWNRRHEFVKAPFAQRNPSCEATRAFRAPAAVLHVSRGSASPWTSNQDGVLVPPRANPTARTELGAFESLV